MLKKSILDYNYFNLVILIFTTEGILLKKTIFREYDETINFFTKDYGKIELISFGSRSLKSKRRYWLSQYFWLKIEIENKNNLNILKELNEIANHSISINDYSVFIFFSQFLNKTVSLLPYLTPDKSIYNLLKFITQPALLNWDSHFKRFFFNFYLLKVLNGLDPFSYCQICQTICSSLFNYIPERGFIGKNCWGKIKKVRGKILSLSIYSLFFYKKILEINPNRYQVVHKFYQYYLKNFSHHLEDWNNLTKLINYWLDRYIINNR